MVHVTLFSSTVHCAHCHRADHNKGLKKRNQSWYCIDCFQNLGGLG